MCPPIAKHPKIGVPISGSGDRHLADAAEFLLGATSVQVCTAIMHYGFRLAEDLIDGLSNWMDEQGFRTIVTFKVIAEIDHAKCVSCHLSTWPARTGAHQSIRLNDGGKVPEILEEKCVGSNLACSSARSPAASP